MQWKKTLDITVKVKELKNLNDKKSKWIDLKVKPVFAQYSFANPYVALFEFNGVQFAISHTDLKEIANKIEKFTEL